MGSSIKSYESEHPPKLLDNLFINNSMRKQN